MLTACRGDYPDLTRAGPTEMAQFLGGPDASALADGVHKLEWQGDTLWFRVENGLKQGYSKSFHPNGGVHRQGSFSSDLPEGWWEEHDSSGTILTSGNYRAGAMDGTWRFFGSVNLRGHTVLNAAPGTLLAEGDVRGNAMNGWWRLFDASGILLHAGSFVNDAPEGHQRYYVGGILREEGTISKGRRTGKWTRYDVSSQIEALDEW